MNLIKKRKIYRILALIDFSMLLVILQTAFVTLGLEYQIPSIDPFVRLLMSGVCTSLIPWGLLILLYKIITDDKPNLVPDEQRQGNMLGGKWIDPEY